MDNNLLDHLTKEFNGLKVAIFLHRNDKDEQVISPLMKANSIKEMVDALSEMRAGIDSLISDLVKAQLKKTKFENFRGQKHV